MMQIRHCHARGICILNSDDYFRHKVLKVSGLVSPNPDGDLVFCGVACIKKCKVKVLNY